MENKESQQEIFGNENRLAGRDITELKINNALIQNNPVEDIGIIEEIFNHVLQAIESDEDFSKSEPEKLLKVQQKIELNFLEVDACDEVNNYYSFALEYVNIIERKFQTLSPLHQKDIHFYIYTLYMENKAAGINSIENLRQLFKQFIPTAKEKNPRYHRLSSAVVLFFFEDCTIFEKN